jgi:RNA polymerase sigma factor for flagellar operon FliA
MLQAISNAPTSPISPTLPHELAVRMIPTIHRIAHQLARRIPRHIRIDDLVGAGFQGLCVAYSRFDSSRGEGFETYAEFRVRGAMLDELRALDPLSRDQRARANRIASAVRSLHLRLGRAPAADEVAAELGVSLETYWEHLAAAATGATQSMGDDEDLDMSAHLPDARVEAADERLMRKQTRVAVTQAIAELPPRLRRVVELHYGEGVTLREIGEQLGVSESRICQILSEAVRRIREHYQAHADDMSAPPVSARRPRRNRGRATEPAELPTAIAA